MILTCYSLISTRTNPHNFENHNSETTTTTMGGTRTRRNRRPSAKQAEVEAAKPKKKKKKVVTPTKKIVAAPAPPSPSESIASIESEPSTDPVAVPSPPRHVDSNVDNTPSTDALTLQDFVASQDFPVEMTLEVISLALAKNKMLFGSEELTNNMKSLDFNTADHEKKKINIEKRFFFVMESHPDFNPLARMIQDPEVPDEQTRMFYCFLRGLPTPLKKRTLNYAMLAFSQTFIMKAYYDKDLADRATWANAQYQPCVIHNEMKNLFRVFKAHGICYSLMKDFSEQGDFQAYWKDLFNKVEDLRPEDYAKRPMAASFDENFRAKRMIAIKSGKLDPINNYSHHCMLVLEEMNSCWALRGNQEVR
jgi:hypothetical protein